MRMRFLGGRGQEGVTVSANVQNEKTRGAEVSRVPDDLQTTK